MQKCYHNCIHAFDVAYQPTEHASVAHVRCMIQERPQQKRETEWNRPNTGVSVQSLQELLLAFFIFSPATHLKRDILNPAYRQAGCFRILEDSGSSPE